MIEALTSDCSESQSCSTMIGTLALGRLECVILLNVQTASRMNSWQGNWRLEAVNFQLASDLAQCGVFSAHMVETQSY